MSCIKFDRPARKWSEALPLGNGKTAVMVFGGRSRERLEFNDAELWSGYPHDFDNPGAAKALTEARELCFGGRYEKAAQTVSEKMDGNYTEAFMPLGGLEIKFSKTSRRGRYSRSLDLDRAVAEIRSGGMEREAFVSYPDKVAAYMVRCGGGFDAAISAFTPLKGGVKTSPDAVMSVYGNAPDKALPYYLGPVPDAVGYDEGKAMAFCLSVKTDTDGAVIVSEKGIFVANATYLKLYATTATGFAGWNKDPVTDREKLRFGTESGLRGRDFNYETLLKRHILDFSMQISGETLYLGESNANADKLTKMRSAKDVAALTGLMYDYGKYLTLCAARGPQPMNLQGQWNDSVRPPWSSNLTTNINFEMNYWATSACNLLPCLESYFKAVEEIAVRGEKTARVNFGAKGFCCNHNSDIWRNTSPVKGDPSYMYAPLCGAWMACEAYRHSLNAPAYRQRAAKLIEGAARFILDYLAEKDGKLTVAPSASPETSFVYDGGRSSVGVGSAFELEIARETLKFAVECASGALKSRAQEALGRLSGVGCGGRGLYEWQSGFDSAERGHRHFSPLYGVYPGTTVTKGDETFEAARKLFYDRLSHSRPGIGWSAAWAMCLAARFSDKQTAEKTLKNFLSRSILPNLFGFHPPRYFQIDANLGFVAGINEMLVTSDKGVLTFLPALPDALNAGKIRGLKHRGVTLSFEWQNGRIVRAESDVPVTAFADNVAVGAVLVNVKIL